MPYIACQYFKLLPITHNSPRHRHHRRRRRQIEKRFVAAKMFIYTLQVKYRRETTLLINNRIQFIRLFTEKKRLKWTWWQPYAKMHRSELFFTATQTDYYCVLFCCFFLLCFITRRFCFCATHSVINVII